MNYKKENRSFIYQRFIELQFSILIIAIAVSQAIPFYHLYKQKALLTEIVTIQTYDRTEVLVHYAMHGTWAENLDKLKTKADKAWIEYVFNNDRRKKIIKQTILENGAIHYILNNGSIGKDKQITFRPAVSPEDQFGPLIWMVNVDPLTENWHVFGKDHTNIDPAILGRYIQ